MTIGEYFQTLVTRGDQVFVFDGVKEPEEYSERDKMPIFNWLDPDYSTTTTTLPPASLPRVVQRRLWLVVGCGLVAVALAGTAGAGSGAGQAFLVTQRQYPLQLVVRGEPVEVGYDAQRAVNLVEVPKATGTLFVRNDLARRFTAVPLKIRRAVQDAQSRRLLRALVPSRLLNGHKLFYYAVIRDTRTGRVVTVPAAGARHPEALWIVNDAFRVQLGTHTFGRPKAPGVVVARAGPAEVGFNDCPGCGEPFGPWSFEVAKNRSVWLLDELGLTPGETSGKVLMWAPERPGSVARTIQLPFGPEQWNRGTEFAVGPAGSLYVLRGAPPPPARGGQRLTRLSASGKELWTSKVGNLGLTTQLRTGPDGTLYWTGGMTSPRDMSGWHARWVPVATPEGRPLSPAIQERRTRWAHPLPGGQQLVTVSTGFAHDPGFGPAPHEARLALVDRAGRVVRAWRVTSRTIIWWYVDKTPALVGSDPVIVLTASTPARAGWEFEYLVLRLGPKGGIRTRFALPYDDPPRSAFGRFAITDIRIAGGKLYQLGSAPDTGAAIYRYSLAPFD
jgi:hypothetical protein